MTHQKEGHQDSTDQEMSDQIDHQWSAWHIGHHQLKQCCQQFEQTLDLTLLPRLKELADKYDDGYQLCGTIANLWPRLDPSSRELVGQELGLNFDE